MGGESTAARGHQLNDHVHKQRMTDRTGSSAVGRRIRQARESAGMTQSALAAGLVSTAYISRIENGDRRPSRAVIEQFAGRLGIPVDELLHSPDDTYWARVGLSQARIRLLAGDAVESRLAAGEVAAAPASADESIARETVRLEALACLNQKDFPRARALLEWLERSDAHASDLTVLAALCRCYLEMGSVQRAVDVGRRSVAYVSSSRLIELPEATEALFWLHGALLAAGDLDEANRVAGWALEADGVGGEPLARVLLKASATEVDHDRAARAASLAERAESILDLVRQRALLDDLRASRETGAPTSLEASPKSDNNVWQNE